MKPRPNTKYRKIITLSSIDGIFSAGLIKRIYDLPHCFKFRVQRASRAILLGIPIADNAEVNQCFIIDNTHCLSGLSYRGSNITLCDDKYGSATDIIVDIFGLEIPEKYLNAVFDSTIGDISSEISKQMYISLLLSTIHERKNLVDLIKNRKWNKIDEWIATKTKGSLYQAIIERTDSLLRKAKKFIRGVNILKFQVSNQIDRISVRPALLYLKDVSKIAIGIGINKNGIITRCYLFSNRPLIKIGKILEQQGFIPITRKHSIIILSVDMDYNNFVEILRTIIRKSL